MYLNKYHWGKKLPDWMNFRKYLSWISMNKEKGFKIELIWGKVLLNENGWGKRVQDWMHLGKYESWSSFSLAEEEESRLNEVEEISAWISILRKKGFR